jgi:hypothetical protein
VFSWLDSATLYALGLVGIAFIYIGFAVADGRPKVIVVESSVTFAFVWWPRRGHRIVVAARSRPGRAQVQGSLAAPHPLRGRDALVAPFCIVVDWGVAAIIAGEIAAGMNFG